jgi:putative phage-type endonuclease
VPELIKTASEAEWLAARRRGVTASEIAVLLGISPYDSPFSLYHRKRGTIDAQPDSDMMERGRVLEPYIAGKWQEAHPELFVQGDGRQLYAHDDRPWELATPDRLLIGQGETDACTCGGGIISPHEPLCGLELTGPVAVLECKVDGGSDEWGEEGTGEVPVHYRAQVLWQMDVMGVDTAYVACLRVRDWRIREYVVQLDDDARADLKLMRHEAAAFLDLVDTGEAPDVDWRPQTIAALKTLNPAVDDDEEAIVSVQLGKRYLAACKNAKHWEQRKKYYEAQLRQQMGSARRAFLPGVLHAPVARRDVYEVGESVRKPYTVDKLVAVKPSKEKK